MSPTIILPNLREAMALVDGRPNAIEASINKSPDGRMWVFSVASIDPRNRSEVRRILNAFLVDLTEMPVFDGLDKHNTVVVPAEGEGEVH